MCGESKEAFGTLEKGKGSWNGLGAGTKGLGMPPWGGGKGLLRVEIVYRYRNELGYSLETIANPEYQLPWPIETKKRKGHAGMGIVLCCDYRPQMTRLTNRGRVKEQYRSNKGIPGDSMVRIVKVWGLG